jgi:hypothetical protein
MMSMENKEKWMGSVTFQGNVTFNGPMFDIHDNEHVHVNVGKQPEQSDEDYEYVDLKFFDDKHFSTMEGQEKLRGVLKNVLPRMDADNGREWIAVYIAYHYYIGREFIMKGQSDFFKDIDGLLPGVLTKVNAEETGDKRYKAYSDLLRLECPKWFILDECLPPMQEWMSKRFDYQVDETRRKRIQQLVKDIYQGLKKEGL